MEPVEAFRSAGRTLFSLGLVKDTEGNLSCSDGTAIRITRTGVPLSRLDEADLMQGPLDGPLPGASSDLAVHLRSYRERGTGAVVHAHPPGMIYGGSPGAHGVYAFGVTLDAAVTEAVRMAREGVA